MQNPAADTAQEFHDVLEGLESALEAPVVPGEMESWIRTVQEAWEPVADRLHIEMEVHHPEQLDEIAKQDDEMLPQVEKLREEDRLIMEQFEEVGQWLTQLVERAPKLEPHEQRADQAVQQLVDNGIDLVVRIRKQESALKTWFVEAFNRDRGIAD